MTRRRWIADEVNADTAALVGERASHLVRVLRAQVGQEFDIAVNGSVRPGKITSISETRVEFALGAALPVAPIADLTIALAIFKFDRMEWAIEKCTELGVARIIPVIARRSDSHLVDAATKRRERWQRLVLQASEQSRRALPPEIAAPVKLRDLGNAVDPVACKIVLSEFGADTRVSAAVTSGSSSLALAIGPEGGWTTEEVQWFQESGWIAASLGDNILRAETAAIVAAALALDALR